MKLKYFIDVNADPDNPKLVEIDASEAHPKSKTAHAALMKKYGASKAARNKYRQSVGLAPEP